MLYQEPASGEQLRRLWQNLKTRQRDAITKERQHRMATGGGGPCPDADVNPDISEIVPALLVEISNTVDSDHDYLNTHTDSSITATETVQLENVPVIIQDFIESSLVQDPEPSQFEHPDTPITPVQEPTTPPNEFSTSEKQLRSQILKYEYLNRKKRADQLHAQQIIFNKEKHEIEMQIMKENLKEAVAKAELAQKNLCNP